jgi:tetratricopeptide (TPR) repeat protein
LRGLSNSSHSSLRSPWDAYLTKATQTTAGGTGPDGWQQKKDAYREGAKYFDLASRAPSGFASEDARVLSRLSEAFEGMAIIDAQEVTISTPEQRDSLIHQRDELRNKSEESLRSAREILSAGKVSSVDSNYRTVILDQGNAKFGREVGALSTDEKERYYLQALSRYQEAGEMIPDDPRPFLYEGLCYERLTDLAQAPEEKAKRFALGEAVLRKALTLSVDSPDYSPALPYRALASLYAHMNDYQSALDSLKNAQRAGPDSTDSARLNDEIQSIERYLAVRQKAH